MHFTQFNERGHLRHLLTLEGLPATLLTELLDRAETFLAAPGSLPCRSQALAGITVGNLFTEPSTRTRASPRTAGRPTPKTCAPRSSGPRIAAGSTR